MAGSDLLRAVLGQSREDAARTLLANPAWAWAVGAALIARHAGQPLIASVGLGDQPLALPEGDDGREFVARWDLALARPVPVWHGLDARHLPRTGDIGPFDVFAALWAGRALLSQRLFDFLTLRDVADARLDVALVVDHLRGQASGEIAVTPETVAPLLAYSDDERRLALAFRRQMVAEAGPHRRQIATGVYVMDRTPLAFLDRQIGYDTLRLALMPRGLFATITRGNWFVPCFWTPEGTNTACVWAHPRGTFALDVLFSCIWRDACIVREQWVETRRGRKGYSSPDRLRRVPNTLVVPRVVYRSAWGQPDEREAIQRQARHAHAVRASYPALAEGHQAREAVERAAEWGYPAPPDGHTFRRPHTRGQGEPDGSPRRIVCKGLQVANIALG